MNIMQQLLEIMARLRDPESGCPWDREQTFETIAPHTIEEAYEVADAIRRANSEELKDELGDLLFQVVFYARLAEEDGDFDFADVVQAISEKMLRRHPHVFGDAAVDNVAEQNAAWESHKAAERREKLSPRDASLLAGVASAMPALMRAEKLQKRAAKAGFDWISAVGAMEKLNEEMREVEVELHEGANPDRLQDEVGDLLFSCVNLARHLRVDAESALRQANHKFEQRFRALELYLADQGLQVTDATPARLDEAWEWVKLGQRPR